MGNLLQCFILHFTFFSGQRILKTSIVSTVHYFLAYLPESTFAGNNEEGRIEEGMIFPQIFLTLIAPHLRLLPLSLQEFDVQVMWSCPR